MHCSYLWELFKGLFKNPISPWLSIPGYLMGIFVVLITLWPIIKFLFPETEDKMKRALPFIRKFRVHILYGLLIISIIFSSYALYENKVPTFATPDSLSQPQLVGLSIKITDLVPVYSNPIVTGKVFEDCEFYGPAVIAYHMNNVNTGDLAIVTEPGVNEDTAIISTINEDYIGVIVFDANIFKGENKFHNISFIESPENAEKMREELRESRAGLEE